MSEENKTEELMKNAAEEDAQVQNQAPAPASGPETPKQSEPEENEDDNISWEDAFKEEEAANVNDKAKTPPEDSAPVQSRGGNSETDASAASGTSYNNKSAASDNIDIDAEDIKPSKKETAPPASKKPVKKLEFASFDESDKTTEPPKNLDFILDIPLTISVELGRTKMVINDMLQLGQGSVIELAKFAGEPLDIYVNGKLMARGEVVLVNDKFGVRLTDIISPVERVKKL